MTSHVPWFVRLCLWHTGEPRKTAEPIEMPFVDAFDEGIHWRHLANTIERPVRNGDAALRQIRSMVQMN